MEHFSAHVRNVVACSRCSAVMAVRFVFALRDVHTVALPFDPCSSFPTGCAFGSEEAAPYAVLEFDADQSAPIPLAMS
jgi:hypothetical protein